MNSTRKMDRYVPPPVRALECGDGSLAIKKDFSQDIDDILGSMLAPNAKAGTICLLGRSHCIAYGTWNLREPAR